MPEYTWLCDDCDYEITESMSIKEYNPKHKKYCPNCNVEVRRKIENVGVKFGKGFFRDGYESAKNVKTSTDGD